MKSVGAGGGSFVCSGVWLNFIYITGFMDLAGMMFAGVDFVLMSET